MRFELLTATTLKITVVCDTNWIQGEIKEIKHWRRMKKSKKRRLWRGGNWI